MNCTECKERLYPENPEIGYTDFHTGRYFPPICQGCPNASQREFDEIAGRVSNLEAISAEAGRIPRRYYDQFKQMSGENAYLRNKLNELLGNKRQPIKPGYKGLAANGR